MSVLAFDIGIKNLAFAVLEGRKVLALENVNLLPSPQVVTCVSCTSKASVLVNQQPLCRRHVPKTHRVHPDLLKKITTKKLRELTHTTFPALTITSATPVAECWQHLSTVYALPYHHPEAVNASKVSLDTVHDALLEMVRTREEMFQGVSHVLLENQPAFKNPHMKSVQVLLFAVLRGWFLAHGSHPEFRFIHAKKKVAGRKGDAGYAERKKKSEERVTALYQGTITGKEEIWKAAKKKSDLADAICMAVDHLQLE